MPVPVGRCCYHFHWSQHPVSERGKERTDRHCGVQTIWQGRGSSGRSSERHLDSCQVRHRTSTYDVVRTPYDIVRQTYDVVLNIVHTISYVRYYIRYCTYDIVRLSTS